VGAAALQELEHPTRLPAIAAPESPALNPLMGKYPQEEDFASRRILDQAKEPEPYMVKPLD